MKTVVILFNTACIYEIVILNYFLEFCGKETVFVSVDGKPIRAMEGYSINIDLALNALDISEIENIIIPGGDVKEINNDEVYSFLKKASDDKILISAICAGVDVLENAEILMNRASTKSSDLDVLTCENVITARANAYVDFAIEVAKKLDLFEDEADLKETIEFWKEHRRV